LRRPLLAPAAPSRGAGLDIGALAPMVDMMTLLLVLLLRTYATDPAPMAPDGHFQLASTVSESPRRAAVEVLVSQEAVYVDGSRVIATAYLPDDLLVRELYDRLLVARNKDRLEIHADASTRYGALRKVLHTARAAGFREISLVGTASAGF
jgi:biopolymer transport protein ExbD